MTFTPKTWKNGPSGGTPLSAAALIDLEERVAAYLPTSVERSSLTNLGNISGAKAVSFKEPGVITCTLTGATEIEPTELPSSPPRSYLLKVTTAGKTFAIKGIVWIGSEPTFGNATYAISLICIEGVLYGLVGLQGATGATGATGEKGEAGTPGSGFSRPYVGPDIYGGSLGSLAVVAAPGTGVGRFSRITVPKTGKIAGFAWLVGLKSGNFRGLIYDVGKAHAGQYSKLWASAGTAVGTLETWQTLAPELEVIAGQEIMCGLVFNNTEAKYCRGSGPISPTPGASLPFGEGPGALPLSGATGTVSYEEPPAEIADATLTASSSAPLIGIHIV